MQSMKTIGWILGLATAIPLGHGLGCGGSGDETTSSASVSSSASGGNADSCNPFGTWEVKYPSSEACSPLSDDTLIVEPASGGGVKVTFAGGKVPESTCAPGEEGKYVTSASLSEDGCTLTASAHAAWCQSGEDQCDERDLTLQVSGDKAVGTIDYRKCWCDGGLGDPFAPAKEYAAEATRKL